jgi:hypothetical protein
MRKEPGARTTSEEPRSTPAKRSAVSPLIPEPSAKASPREPREPVYELEASPRLPSGLEERFAGYGVMGLPFRSGHLLAMRRFPASSIGPGYRSVWHRDPHGRWTFFQDVAPEIACTRYFGAAIDEVVDATIDIDWSAPSELSITVVGGGHRLDWHVTLTSSVTTRLMNAIGAVLPERWWRSHRFLAFMAMVSGTMLRAGKLGLTGRAPNGQRFTAAPLRVWLIADTAATVDGVDLGEMGPASTPGELGDFRIPQRGIFAIGRAFFDSDFNRPPSSSTARR